MTDRATYLRRDHLDRCSNFAILLVGRSKVRHESLVAACEGRIEIRPIVGGDMTQQPFYRRQVPGGQSGPGLPNAALVHAQGLYVGNNPDLDSSELREILEMFAPVEQTRTPGAPLTGPGPTISSCYPPTTAENVEILIPRVAEVFYWRVVRDRRGRRPLAGWHGRRSAPPGRIGSSGTSDHEGATRRNRRRCASATPKAAAT